MTHLVLLASQVAQLRRFAAEVTRVALEVGTEGELGGTANVDGAQGEWKSLVSSVNTMAMNLTQQVRSIADVTRAVAEGDLSRKIDVKVKGEMLDLKVRPDPFLSLPLFLAAAARGRSLTRALSLSRAAHGQLDGRLAAPVRR